jgi:hypothetical protein
MYTHHIVGILMVAIILSAFSNGASVAPAMAGATQCFADCMAGGSGPASDSEVRFCRSACGTSDKSGYGGSSNRIGPAPPAHQPTVKVTGKHR